MALLNPAGGLRYHWRALRHSQGLWKPFREGIARWLSDWKPPETELILIGPSAGYCLDRAFLARFHRVVCVDPDPIAHLLFSARMKLPWVESCDEDFFTGTDEERRLERFQDFLARHPDAAVLFPNFLGQLWLLLDDTQIERVLPFWKRELLGLLGHRSWASFHDRFSGTLTPSFAQPLRTETRPADAEILKLCYSPSSTGMLNDHMSDRFFPENLPHWYFTWHLTRRRWHLIEAVKSS